MARLVIFGGPDDPRKWVECTNKIAALIACGRYPDGEWLPALADLSADLSVSALTVRKALNEICALKLISHVEPSGYCAGNGLPPKWPAFTGCHQRK